MEKEERENRSGSIHKAKQIMLHTFLHNFTPSQEEDADTALHHKELGLWLMRNILKIIPYKMIKKKWFSHSMFMLPTPECFCDSCHS
jgi:hypothetical protein